MSWSITFKMKISIFVNSESDIPIDFSKHGDFYREKVQYSISFLPAKSANKFPK